MMYKYKNMPYLNNVDYLIMSLWAFFFFIFLALPFFKKEKSKTGNVHLSPNKNIALLTKMIFISGTAFYSVSFLRIGKLEGLSFENISGTFFFIGLLLVIVGMILMLVSRWQLRNLNNKQVFFSINNSKLVTDGIYRHMNHPMYVGLIMIFLGSFIIYRNPVSLIFFFAILYFVYKKIIIEKRLGGAIN